MAFELCHNKHHTCIESVDYWTECQTLPEYTYAYIYVHTYTLCPGPGPGPKVYVCTYMYVHVYYMYIATYTRHQRASIHEEYEADTTCAINKQKVALHRPCHILSLPLRPSLEKTQKHTLHLHKHVLCTEHNPWLRATNIPLGPGVWQAALGNDSGHFYTCYTHLKFMVYPASRLNGINKRCGLWPSARFVKYTLHCENAQGNMVLHFPHPNPCQSLKYR